VKIWAAQIRAPFLLLAIVLVLLGGAAAWQDQVFNGWRFFWTMLGVVLAHVAVNLFNEFSDYQTGIDFHTKRTPFSGGSGNLQKGLTSFRAVRMAAYGSLLAAFAIGVCLTWAVGWILMVYMVIGGMAIVFYTSHLARWLIGELAAGLCLGTLVILGTYYAQAGMLSPGVVWLSIPPGILTGLLLLLNEFPDVEADRRGGRRNLVIILGWKRAAGVYTLVLAACYLLLAMGIFLGRFPITVLLAGLTLPLAGLAVFRAWKYGDCREKMTPALGANVGVVLGTNLLLAAAYMLR
ncbi:prenyltransferase, partial [bacterium]|nr:prenyltransferase [bacterium]